MAQAQGELLSELMGEEAFALHQVFLPCFCYQATLAKVSAVATLGSFSVVPGR